MVQMKTYLLYLQENPKLAEVLYFATPFLKEIFRTTIIPEKIFRYPDLVRFVLDYKDLVRILIFFPDFVPDLFAYLFGDRSAVLDEIVVIAIESVSKDAVGIVFTTKTATAPVFSITLPIQVWKDVYEKLKGLGVKPDESWKKVVVTPEARLPLLPHSDRMPVEVEEGEDYGILELTFNHNFTLRLNKDEAQRLCTIIHHVILPLSLNPSNHNLTGV